MAPRRGGGSSSGSNGGSSSSSSSCYMCGRTYYMSSQGYDSTTARAVLAFEIISIIVVIACLIAVIRRPWLQLSGQKERVKYWLYMGTGFSALGYLIIVVVDSILHQVEITTTYAYFIVYIFRSLFWRVSDILMIAVILRCLEGGRSAVVSRRSRLRIMHYVAIAILAMLAIVAWSLYTRYIAGILSADYSDAVDATAPVEMTYSVIVFVVALYMVGLASFLAVKRAIPVASSSLITATAIAYWLSTLLNLIFFTTVEYDFSSYSASLAWANSFIGVFSLIAVFIFLALLSRLSNKKTREMIHKGDQGVAMVNAPREKWDNAQQSHQRLNSDTSYHGGGYQGQDWSAGQGTPAVGTYTNTESHDPAAQPLYPSSAYNPPQQTNHVYDSAGPQPHMQEQRFYSNNSGYSAVPQTLR